MTSRLDSTLAFRNLTKNLEWRFLSAVCEIQAQFVYEDTPNVLASGDCFVSQQAARICP